MHDMTAANLRSAYGGESMAHMRYKIWAEKIHAKMYAAAKECVGAGKDIELGPVQICKVCGHTVEGDAPDECPIC